MHQTIFHNSNSAKMSVPARFLRRKVITICSFLLLLQFTNAQYDFSYLDAKLEGSKKSFSSQFVLYVVKDGKAVYTKKMGDFDPKLQVPIGFISQWLSSALILQLADEGKIDLDDKLVQFIPEMAKYSRNYITFKHCITHQTGLMQDKSGIAGMFKRKKYTNLEEEANDIIKRDIDFNAGESFLFGSVGLNLAARAAEIATKKKFEQLMQEKITRPLMMRSTIFYNEDGGAPNPSAGGKSTAVDITQFLQMLLNKGMVNGKKVLNESTVEACWSVQVENSTMRAVPKTADGLSFGLGSWIVPEMNGDGAILVGLGMNGSWAWVDKKRNYSAVFLTKETSGEDKRPIMLQIQQLVEQAIDLK